MKKILALILALVMVLAFAACGSTSDDTAADTTAATTGEVTWADYQAYLIEKAGANAPDLDEFTAQVEAINSWEELDQTVSPWDQMFTTIGLSTWEEFQAGNVKEPAVAGGVDASASGEPSGEASEEPAAETVEDASGEMGSGEPSGEKADAEADYEITVDGVTATAHYQDTDNGDEATKSFEVTFNGATITGAIDKGVWTADSGDAADQAVIDAVQAAFEGNNTVGPQA